MTKEEKQAIKAKSEEIFQEHGYCMIDNHRETMGNFKIEPLGLSRKRRSSKAGETEEKTPG